MAVLQQAAPPGPPAGGVRRAHASDQRDTFGEDFTRLRVVQLMSAPVLTCGEETSVRQAACLMRDHRISALPVLRDECLVGIVTNTDLSNRVLAQGLDAATAVADVMTREPRTLSPDAPGADALSLMAEQKLHHLPVIGHGRLIGIVSQSDLLRRQSAASGHLIDDIAWAADVDEIAASVARIPEYLLQLVSARTPHQSVTRLITDIGDAATRRLLALAEARLGPAPVPYLWLACGSQGRQEQTGVSDQDNCLFLSDRYGDADDEYFTALAAFVCDGLNACGYFYCPGEMMASNPRWRQPLRVWRDYFSGWIRQPDPMAQMLASVMFDLRPIGGDVSLFGDLQMTTLKAASDNSIFIAHMIANSLKHKPPLSWFNTLYAPRLGEHRNAIDLKHNGVIPVVDLARIYALQGRIGVVNTRARLGAAAGDALSTGGARDLIDAYDLINDTRLEQQAVQIREGRKPSNYLPLICLSGLERRHLRDAFRVVQVLQTALLQSRAPLS